MLRFAIAAGFCALVALMTVDASACTCLPPPPPLEMLEQSDLVAVGRVMSISEHSEEFMLSVVIETHAAWKSPGSLIFPSYQLITANDGATCGYHFELGQDYLIYARDDGTGAFATDLCGRNQPLASAGDDLNALGPPLVVELSGPSFGTVKASFHQR